MKMFVTCVSLAAALWMSSISAAQAQLLSSLFNWWRPRTDPTTPTVANVPEIDASTGLLAVAAIVAVLLLVWERSRRSSKVG